MVVSSPGAKIVSELGLRSADLKQTERRSLANEIATKSNRPQSSNTRLSNQGGKLLFI